MTNDLSAAAVKKTLHAGHFGWEARRLWFYPDPLGDLGQVLRIDLFYCQCEDLLPALKLHGMTFGQAGIRDLFIYKRGLETGRLCQIERVLLCMSEGAAV